MRRVPTVEELRERLPKEPLLMVEAMWMEAFRLPSSDERFLSLTPHEALRQVVLVEALRVEKADRIRKAKEQAAGIERPPEVKEIRGEEAEKLAGPHLSGDPEFDSIELMETDPLRDLPRVRATVRRG